MLRINRNNMIDHIIIINLKRREDKWYFMLGTLASAQFDIHRKDFIKRYIAHDGKDYRDEIQVRDAAVADGFEYFARYDGSDRKVLAGQMALNWTWASGLRTIVEMPKDSMALFLQDDRYPSPKYSADRVEGLARQAVRDREHGDFLGLQLNLGMGSGEYGPSSSLNRGWIGSGHGAFLLSPNGAAVLLNRFSAYQEGFVPLGTLVSDIGKRGRYDEKSYKGFWHVGENAFYSYGFFDSDIRDYRYHQNISEFRAGST